MIPYPAFLRSRRRLSPSVPSPPPSSARGTRLGSRDGQPEGGDRADTAGSPSGAQRERQVRPPPRWRCSCRRTRRSGSVSTMPVPGWTVAVENASSPAGRGARQSAHRGGGEADLDGRGERGVKPGQFQELPVSLGPLRRSRRWCSRRCRPTPTATCSADRRAGEWWAEPGEPGAGADPWPLPRRRTTLLAANEATLGTRWRRRDDADGLRPGRRAGRRGSRRRPRRNGAGGLAFARTRRQPTPKA